MAPSVEIEGKNVEQAVEKASSKYQIEKDHLTYEIVSYGSSGIFGLGKSRNAKIRVKLPEETTPRNIEATGSNPDQDVKSDVQALVEETFDTPQTDHDSEVSIEEGKRVLQKIVDAITDDASVAVSANHNGVVYQVEGGNAAVVIGKHGQTLEAIQTIIDKVVNKVNEKRTRVQIDVAGYLKNREATLQKQAEKQAEKCVRIGKPVTLGYMNANDRRIVHLTLKDNHGVRTQSVGDGPQRKLVIFPKKQQNGGRRKRSHNSR